MPPVRSSRARHVRTLFKRLVRAVHPDKGGDAMSFRQAMAAYKSGDLLRLLVRAHRNRVPVRGCVCERDARALELEIAGVKARIRHMKSTRAWRWGTRQPPRV